MRDFMIMFLICSATMSSVAIFYMLITPLISKRYSEKWIYYAWLVIVIGLIVPFRPHFNTTVFEVTVPSDMANIIYIENGTILTENAAVPTLPHISKWQIVFILWIVGVFAFTAFHIIRHHKFMRMIKRWSEDITDEQTTTIFYNIKSEMGISKQIILKMCDCVNTPLMIGFIIPQIILPKMDITQDEMTFIFKHELVHFKKKDLWYKSLVLIATALHWFNPVVHLIARFIDTQCELSCDAEVVRDTAEEERRQYSEAIIGIIRQQARLKTALSTNFYGGKKGMKKRISSILDTKKKRIGALIVCCAIVLTIGTGAVLAANNYSPKLVPAEPQETTNSSDAIEIAETPSEQFIFTETEEFAPDAKDDTETPDTLQKNEKGEFKREDESDAPKLVATSESESSSINVTAAFGERIHPITKETKMHNGIDIAAPKGTEVCAIMDGKVLEIGYDEDDGNYIIIGHSNGITSKYATLNEIKVHNEQTVVERDTIGSVGASGRSTGPHLHLEIAINGTPVDPLNYDYTKSLK